MTGVLDTRSRPLRDLRISVTDRCNFRCPYCMPREIFGRDYEFLPRAELLSFEEITRLVRVFAESGVIKVRCHTSATDAAIGSHRQLTAADRTRTLSLVDGQRARRVVGELGDIAAGAGVVQGSL
jgi:hypothetical protein